MGSRFHSETVWGRRSGRGHGIGSVPCVAFKLCSSGPTPTTALVLDFGSECWKKLAGFMYLQTYKAMVDFVLLNQDQNTDHVVLIYADKYTVISIIV